jgi:hypothetical protein
MNPSLLLIPDRYKAAKLYSQIPDSGAGDLTFARNSNATRVNSAGLIEKVQTNLVLYSEQFNDAAWSKSNITVTANSTANPINGATTADTITVTGVTTGFASNTIAQTGIVTFSIFAKSGSTNLVRLNTFDGSVDRGATYNLTTGAITSVYGSPLFTLAQDFGNGWYRVSVSVNASSYVDCQVHIDSVNSVVIFGAQLETGDIATPYIPTTTAAVSVGITADIPRLDYTGGGCPSLLLEPQRANLITFSEQFDNAVYSKTRGTITANAIASPDGYTNADLWAQNSGEITAAALLQNVTPVLTTTYSLSVFAKKENKNFLGIRANSVSSVPSYFNLENGTLGTINSLHTAKIEDYGNGWYRCSITYTAIILSTGNIFYPTDGSSLTVTDSGGIYLWGAQLEAGAYATSYIPTLGSSVTRLADAASKTSASALIGQTEGTLFSEIVVNGFADFGTALCINDGSTDESIWLTTFANGDIRAEVFSTAGGGVQASFIKSGNVVGQTYKLAFGYATNNFAFFVNGAQVGTTDTSGAVPAGMSRVDFDYVNPASFVQSALKINAAALYPTRLSNSELQSLTTL